MMTGKSAFVSAALIVALACTIQGPVSAESASSVPSAEDLAKKLANPVAALISVPFQLNCDTDIGSADDGERWTLNIQPVVPIALNADWNLSGPSLATRIAATSTRALFSPF
jgi:hypothetical protein